MEEGVQSYFGWLKTPLVHDMAMLPYEAVPYVCLRVRAIPATEQPAKKGPCFSTAVAPVLAPTAGRRLGVLSLLRSPETEKAQHQVSKVCHGS